MRKFEIFPSKYFKPEDLNDRPMTVTIDHAPLETLKSPDGKEQRKIVLYFRETPKGLPLNLTNFDACAEICGDDTDGWPGKRIELYPTTTPMGGKIVPCIRIRPAGKRQSPATNSPAEAPTGGEFVDEIPF